MCLALGQYNERDRAGQQRDTPGHTQHWYDPKEDAEDTCQPRAGQTHQCGGRVEGSEDTAQYASGTPVCSCELEPIPAPTTGTDMTNPNTITTGRAGARLWRRSMHNLHLLP